MFSLQLLLLPLAAAFSPAALPKLRPACAVASQTPVPIAMPPLTARSPHRRLAPAVEMGLFGLGWAELGVIGVIVLFVLGPDKLAPYAKGLGKSASGLKEVTDSFAEGMAEGNVNADMLKSANDPVIKVEEVKKETKKEEGAQ